MKRYIDAEELKKELAAWAVNLGNPKMLNREDAELVIDLMPALTCHECRAAEDLKG